MSLPLFRSVLVSGIALAMLGVSRSAAPPMVERPRVDAVGDPLPDDAVARIGTARFREQDLNVSIALSPDGKFLAVTGCFGAHLLDTTTGKEVWRIANQELFRDYGRFVFSPDGKLLAVFDNSGIVVCDVMKAKVLSKFRGSGRLGTPIVSFSGDGSLLAGGGEGFREELSATIWDVAARKEKRKLEVNYNHEVRVALSPDGKTLATWGEDLQPREEAILQLWDTATGMERLKIKTDVLTIQKVVFSPDGKQIVVAEGGSGSLCVWDAAAGKLLHQFTASTQISVAYSPDGRVLATADYETIQLWDPVLGRRLGKYKPPPQTHVASIAFLPGNKVLAAGVSNQMVRIWEVPSGKERTPPLGHRAAVLSLAFSRDGAKLFSAGADGVRIHALSTGKEVRRIESPPYEFGRLIRRIDRSTFHRFNSLLSADGRYLAWTNWEGNRMTVVDTSSDEDIADMLHTRGPLGAALAFAPDGPTIASLGEEIAGGNQQLVAQVWDLETCRLRSKIKLSSTGNLPWCMAISPRGKALVVAPTQPSGGQSAVTIWDIATGKEITRLPIGAVDALTFSPDGSLLATSDGEMINLWNAAGGRVTRSMEGADGRITRLLRFSPDGRLLAIVSEKRNSEADDIRLYEIASGTVRAKFPGHRGGTLSLAFSPDGRTLASGGTDTTVMLWDVTGVTALARSRLGKPTSAELSALWSNLDKADAVQAHKAMARLTACPSETIALIRRELKPGTGTPLEEKEIQRRIADLGSDSFEVREKASKWLGEAGLAVQSAMIKAQEETQDLEKKRRLEKLLRALRPGPTPEMLQTTRALELLEHLGTPEARKLVQSLAKGNPRARLTIEAKVTLRRMQKAR